VRRAEAVRQIEVRPGDFVVDVGGGHRPFDRANLIVEKYPFEGGLHRTGAMRFPAAPVIKADACHLPIPDGGCDLIIASHLIEHLPQPDRFVTELKRCCGRVYLEFPSRLRELMLAWSFHEWLVEADGPVLKFYRNDLPQLFGPFFHREHDAALGAWSEVRHEQLNTSVYCRADELRCLFPTQTATEMLLGDSPRGRDKIDFVKTIHRPRYSLREVAAMLAQSMLPPGIYTAWSLKREATNSPAPLPDSIVARLMCLRCHSAALRNAGDKVVCKCGAEYRKDKGIFDFDVAHEFQVRGA